MIRAICRNPIDRPHGGDQNLDVPGYPTLNSSICNPEGETSTDLPLLLRRLADWIEEEGIKHEDILDLVISGDEITEHGSWWRATLYWAPDDARHLRSI